MRMLSDVSCKNLTDMGLNNKFISGLSHIKTGVAPGLTYLAASNAQGSF